MSQNYTERGALGVFDAPLVNYYALSSEESTFESLLVPNWEQILYANNLLGMILR